MKQKRFFFLLYTFFKKGKRDTPDLDGSNKISSTNQPEKNFFLLYTFYKKGKRDTPYLEGAKIGLFVKNLTVNRLQGNISFI